MNAPLISPRTSWLSAPAEGAGVIVDAANYYTAFYQAALRAQRYILLSGWQFDSGVPLIRGEDEKLAEAAAGKTRLRDFLNQLCDARPDLNIYMLAWDFHMVLAMEREWLQRVIFAFKTSERFHFRFDSKHPDGGCHHQKFAIIDGTVAFNGGIDLCEDRWDDRAHMVTNELRISRGRPQKPYHDVQAYVLGENVVKPFVELFTERWRRAGGDPLQLPPCDHAADSFPAPRGALTLPPGPLALSRTDPRGCHEGDSVREIAQLYIDAIASAQSLIYLETQYFSSREVTAALEARMRDASKPRLNVVVLVNRRAEALKEQLAVGLRQAENLERLRRVARETGHPFGCYYSVADAAGAEESPKPEKGDAASEETPVYIHSKLGVFDDRVLTVGSANLTNRSMGLDTELNLTWEAGPDDARLVRSIRRVRVSLMAEHAGLQGPAAVRQLVSADGMVERMDAMATRGQSRLRPLQGPTESEGRVLELIDPQQLPFDPAAPDEEGARAEMAEDAELFRLGFAAAWQRLIH